MTETPEPGPTPETKSERRFDRKERKAPKPKKKMNFFVRGLVVLLPTVLTVFVFVTVVNFVNTYLTTPINGTLLTLLDSNGFGWKVLGAMDVDPFARPYLAVEDLPIALQERLGPNGELGDLGSSAAQAAIQSHRDAKLTFIRNFEKLAINREKLRNDIPLPRWIGIVIAASLVLFLGYLASGFLGRTAINSFDRMLHRIPVVKSVYPYTKQLVDFFLSESELEFDTVVAAPYPSEGVWAIGFVTGGGLRSVHQALGAEYVSVFIPTSPMPMTGFTVFIEANRLIPLDITVDEAIRTVVSVGVLVPASEQVLSLDEPHERRAAFGLDPKPGSPKQSDGQGNA
ncbi:MAG: DUF502 domain-containing protein [Planctomycetota bacterium]